MLEYYKVCYNTFRIAISILNYIIVIFIIVDVASFNNFILIV